MCRSPAHTCPPSPLSPPARSRLAPSGPPIFRELAKQHARIASQLLTALPSRPDAREVAILEAQAHAMTSMACSQVAPPERRPRTVCRTVELAGVDR